MAKRWLDKYVWNFMNSDEEWWVKGFLVGAILAIFVMSQIMR